MLAVSDKLAPNFSSSSSKLDQNGVENEEAAITTTTITTAVGWFKLLLRRLLSASWMVMNLRVVSFVQLEPKLKSNSFLYQSRCLNVSVSMFESHLSCCCKTNFIS